MIYTVCSKSGQMVSCFCMDVVYRRTLYGNLYMSCFVSGTTSSKKPLHQSSLPLYPFKAKHHPFIGWPLLIKARHALKFAFFLDDSSSFKCTLMAKYSMVLWISCIDPFFFCDSLLCRSPEMFFFFFAGFFQDCLIYFFVVSWIISFVFLVSALLVSIQHVMFYDVWWQG